MTTFMIVISGSSGAKFGAVIFGEAEALSWELEYGAYLIRLGKPLVMRDR